MSFLSGFVHPLLPWAAGLAAVPLLIHLLNRRRHRPLAWAAMRFVLEAYRKTRRRAQLENLLLLLLRMAAVALLAFAISRPFTDRDSLLEPLTESRRHVALLVDASASTGYRESVKSVHEEILDRAREILATLDGTRGDRVQLIRAAGTATSLPGRTPEDALAVLSTLSEPTDEPLDLAAVLGEVARLAEEESAGTGESGLEVRLLTDLQRRSFLPDLVVPMSTESVEGTEGGPARDSLTISRALDRLEELGVAVVVEDLGASALQPPNLGLEAIEPLDGVLGVDLPVDIGVRVRNFGGTGRAAVRVALEVDGVRQPSRKVDVTSNGAGQAVFPVTFHSSGYHTLLARLEGDRLSVDDTRGLVLRIPPPLRVLLVNGDPRTEIDLDEVGFLRAILDPPDDGTATSIGGPGFYSPFATRVVDAAALGGAEEEIDEADVIVLANVAGMSSRIVERIERRVAQGAAALFTLGDRVADPSALAAANERLVRSDGTGLLPARLTSRVEVADRREAYYRTSWFEEQHPAFTFFTDDRWRSYLTEAPVYAFVASEPREDAVVLARLDDAASSPLLIERDYDRGRVFLWTTTIDKAWTRIPESPRSFVPLVHELLRYSVAGTEPPRNATVGSSVTLEVASFPRQPIVVRPDGSRRSLDDEPTSIGEDAWRLPPLPELDRAGLWHVEFEGAPELAFAVQLDPGEGDLHRLDPDELESIHPALRYLPPEEDGDLADDGSGGARGELWRWFARAALLALVLETLWAAVIGRGRRLV